MPIRVSGLISGMDTDSLVQELMSAYDMKTDKYVKEQTRLEWQMDAWKGLNTKVYSFYTNKLSNMRFTTGYTKKSVKVSDDTKATISGTNSAVNGDQTLAINKLAKTGYLTGAELSTYTDANGNEQKVTTKTKMSELGFSGEGTINVKVDGKEASFTVTEDMTVAKFVSKLKDAGLNASFDETNQRMFVSAKESGAEHDFALIGDTNGVNAMKNLGIFAMSEADKAQYEVMANYTDEELKEFALNDYLKQKITEANKTYTDKNTEYTDANKKLNEQLTYAKLSAEKRGTKYTELQKKIDELETQKAAAQANGEEWTDANEEKLNGYKETMAMYDEVNTAIGVTMTEETDADGNKTFKASEADETLLETYKTNTTDTINANKEKIEENDKAVAENNKILEKKYTADEITALEFTAYGEADSKTIADYASDEAYTKIYDKYVQMRQEMADISNTSSGNLGLSQAVRIEGQDSEIVLNGATFTSNSNNYSINGLTITATGITAPGEEITVTTSTDVDAVYDMIVDFFDSYNELIKEMDTLYNADSSKGYEPLTDEEKDAMSDTEVEKWEKKIKDSLLRRDSTLSGVISAMKTAMQGSFEIDGKKYSLSSFGIATAGYFSSGENEKGVFHIDGNTKDSTVSGKEDKLKAMLANDPDTVVSFFNQLTTGVYDALTKKMASSTMSSAYTIYNDKTMQKRYDEYDDIIEEWEDKVEKIADRYYNQFAAMEKALAEMQSSSSSLASLMA